MSFSNSGGRCKGRRGTRGARFRYQCPGIGPIGNRRLEGKVYVALQSYRSRRGKTLLYSAQKNSYGEPIRPSAALRSSEADFLSRFRRALRVFGSLTFPTRIRFSSSRKKKLAPSLPAKVPAERAAGCRQVKYCRRTWFCSACTSRFENAPQGRISASTEGTLRTVDSRLQPASAGRNDGR